MPFRPHRKPRRETPPAESRSAKPQRPIRRADSEPTLRRERPAERPTFQREERSEQSPPPRRSFHNDNDDRASDALHYAVGRRAALELLKDASALKRIEKIYIAHGVQGGQIVEILHLARKNKVTTGELDRGKFRELERRTAQHTDSQGVIVLLAQRGYQELEDVVTFSNERASGEGQSDRSSFAPPLLIALDGVEDPHNIGAIIRSAEASGANAILLPKRGAVITPAVYKTSAGAANNLAIVKYGNLEQTIRLMQEEFGVACYGLAGEAEETIYDVDLTGPICFVTGGEEKGLHRLVRERCEKIVKIPLAGKTASLNASVASAVALFEAVRQRAKASGPNVSQDGRKQN